MIYISLIRGINVAGKKTIKMAALRESYLALGFKEVQTYVQSGNVVFTAAKATDRSLSEKIREKIFSDYGVEVSVMVRTPKEFESVIHNNPFLKKKGIDVLKLHVTFLSDPPQESVLSNMDRFKTGKDDFHLSGKVVYVYCQNGYGNTKISNNAFEKAFSVSATTRNWKTVNELHLLASQESD
jgi:uncharacterized protein (DUF1697 family)